MQHKEGEMLKKKNWENSISRSVNCSHVLNMHSKALESFTYLHQVPGPKGSLQFTNPDLFYVVQVIVNTGIKENLLTYLSYPSPHPLLGIIMNEQP